MILGSDRWLGSMSASAGAGGGCCSVLPGPPVTPSAAPWRPPARRRASRRPAPSPSPSGRPLSGSCVCNRRMMATTACLVVSAVCVTALPEVPCACLLPGLTVRSSGCVAAAKHVQRDRRGRAAGHHEPPLWLRPRWWHARHCSRVAVLSCSRVRKWSRHRRNSSRCEQMDGLCDVTRWLLMATN